LILDVNLLLYATDTASPFYLDSAAWWQKLLNSDCRVGVPEQTLLAYLRLATHPKIYRRPKAPAVALSTVNGWLARKNVWIPDITPLTMRVLGVFADQIDISGNLMNDALLAALAITHGVPVASHDEDLKLFPPLWSDGFDIVDPLAP
jgi:uncharacterized protein